MEKQTPPRATPKPRLARAKTANPASSKAGVERADKAFRLRASPADLAQLEKAAQMFGVKRSVLIRKLVRAAADAGPAISADAAVALLQQVRETRAIGRNLAQVLKAINAGYAVQLADLAPTIVAIADHILLLDEAIVGMTEGYGARVRALARLRLREAA